MVTTTAAKHPAARSTTPSKNRLAGMIQPTNLLATAAAAAAAAGTSRHGAGSKRDELAGASAAKPAGGSNVTGTKLPGGGSKPSAFDFLPKDAPPRAGKATKALGKSGQAAAATKLGAGADQEPSDAAQPAQFKAARSKPAKRAAQKAPASFNTARNAAGPNKAVSAGYEKEVEHGERDPAVARPDRFKDAGVEMKKATARGGGGAAAAPAEGGPASRTRGSGQKIAKEAHYTGNKA